MKRLADYYLVIERRLHDSDDYTELMRFPETMSVEQAEDIRDRLEMPLPTAKVRLVEVRIEETRTVLV